MVKNPLAMQENQAWSLGGGNPLEKEMAIFPGYCILCFLLGYRDLLSHNTFRLYTYPYKIIINLQFSSVQSLSHVRLFATPWIATHQASLSITNSWSLLKFISIELVMPSNHLILCRLLLLLPSIFPSIMVFSNELVLHIMWPKYWSFSFNISPSNKYSGLISFRMDFLDLFAV